MNDYSKRSQIYNIEFNTTEDFPILEKIINNNDPVLDIPCGAGRLIDLYVNCRNKRVYLVDREPSMISKCQDIVIQAKLNFRIFPCIGDLRNWIPPEKLGLILISRGGIQLLRSKKEIRESILHLTRYLKNKGKLYIDIADPWESDIKNQILLPEFMRFKGSKIIQGETGFHNKEGIYVIRKYNSKLYDNHLTAKLLYKVENKHTNKKLKFSSVFSWRRIRYQNLEDIIKITGLNIKKCFGDYNFNNYTKGSSRIICIIQKE